MAVGVAQAQFAVNYQDVVRAAVEYGLDQAFGLGGTLAALGHACRRLRQVLLRLHLGGDVQQMAR